MKNVSEEVESSYLNWSFLYELALLSHIKIDYPAYWLKIALTHTGHTMTPLFTQPGLLFTLLLRLKLSTDLLSITEPGLLLTLQDRSTTNTKYRVIRLTQYYRARSSNIDSNYGPSHQLTPQWLPSLVLTLHLCIKKSYLRPHPLVRQVFYWPSTCEWTSHI